MKKVLGQNQGRLQFHEGSLSVMSEHWDSNRGASVTLVTVSGAMNAIVYMRKCSQKKLQFETYGLLVVAHFRFAADVISF